MRIQPLALGVLAALAFLPLALHAQPAVPELPALPSMPGAPVATAAAPTTPAPVTPALPETAPAKPAIDTEMPALPEPEKTAPEVALPQVETVKPAAVEKTATTKPVVKKKKKAKTPATAKTESVKTPTAPAKPVASGPSCTATSRVATQNYPGAKVIPTSNNLLKPAGKALEAEGQKIVITGRVLDAQCAPVVNANVELWQNSPTGRWLLAGSDDLASAGRVFAGAGRTYTDNEGKFSFITAFPAPLGKKAPFVNVKVSGQGIADLSTALYFSDDKRNELDETYKKLAGKPRSDVTIEVQQDDEENLTGTVDLVISGKAPYRTY